MYEARSPALTMRKFIAATRTLLVSPDLDWVNESPIKTQFKKGRDEFNRIAREVEFIWKN